jgi:uncharacterized protein
MNLTKTQEAWLASARAAHPGVSDERLLRVGLMGQAQRAQHHELEQRVSADAELQRELASSATALRAMNERDAQARAVKVTPQRDKRATFEQRFAGRVTRAHSTLTVRRLDKVARIVTGIATTPTADRYGDVVLPTGAKYKLPLPALWQHDSMQPVGSVIAAKVSAQGIDVTIAVPSVEDGPLADRIEQAWQSVHAGLVRGLSIGFRPLPDGFEQRGDGTFLFREWEWLETSLVTIPANPDAQIA